jgi:single-strand DNA-binding protein
MVQGDHLGKLSELCAQYLAKGRLVLVEGEIDASSWVDKEGNARATLELNAKNVRFLGGGNSHEDGEKPAAKPAPKPTSKQAAPAPTTTRKTFRSSDTTGVGCLWPYPVTP